MVVCYLGVGSNLGDRRENIRRSIKELNSLKSTKVLKASRIVETEPEACPAGSPKFLNAALKISTNLSPLLLLKNLKNIEKKLGRVKSIRNAPRPIDLDILFYGNKVIKTKKLKIPHPRMFERKFVIKSLLEVL